jgi:hypothetical protein
MVARAGLGMALLGLVTALGAPACNIGRGCTLIGCAWTAVVLADVPGSWAEASAAMIVVCRNGVCQMGTLAGAVAAPPVGVGLGVPLHDSSPSDAGILAIPQVSLFNAAGGVYLQASWPANLDVKNGDVYQVSVMSGSGETIVSLSETASYTVSTPNGPDCGPTCHSFTADRRQAGADR